MLGRVEQKKVAGGAAVARDRVMIRRARVVVLAELGEGMVPVRESRSSARTVGVSNCCYVTRGETEDSDGKGQKTVSE